MIKRLAVLIGVALLSLALFMLYDMNYAIFDYIIGKRMEKVAAMALVAVAIGISTLTFQAITNSRILTPGVLGLDGLYSLFQLMTVAVFGTFNVVVMNPYMNFTLSAVLMSGFSLILYRWVFSKAKSIFLIVLVGVVMGTLFTSINGMLQIMLSPDVFNLIMERLFANFNNVNRDLIGISCIIILGFSGLLFRKRYVLDVLSLGKDHSINLGIHYHREVMQLLVMVFILVSVSAALVGPITFLGFFAVNIAKNYMKHHKHVYLMIATCLIAITSLLIGQFLVEHLLDFGLPISVLINLIGSSYFIYMLLKENRV